MPTIAISAVACASESSNLAITIKTQPQDQVAVVGQTANIPTFSVAVNDIKDAKLNYQWYSNTTNSTDKATKIADATSNSYVVTADNLKNAGTTYFYVQISGINGVNKLKTINSNIVSLTVNPSSTVVIETQPVNKTVFLNQTQNLPILSISAVANDKNAKLTYQWYENDLNSTTNGKPIAGANNHTYKISESDATKIGTKHFYVVINSEINNNILNSATSNLATLTVTDKLPLITVQSPAQVEPVIIGQTENLPIFSVKATTNHPDEKLTYQWFFLKENDPSQSGTKINGATSSSYQTKADDVKTVGNIYFYVEIKGSINGFNLEIKYSDSNLLKVDELPEILVFPGSSTTATVVIGQTQNLPTFSIEATTTSKLEEKLTYQWYFNTTNSTTNGTPIQGATNDSYTIKQNEIGSTATRKYYYVKINGSVNGVSLIPIDSEVRTLIINNA